MSGNIIFKLLFNNKFKRGTHIYPEVSHGVNLERLLHQAVRRIYELLAGDDAGVVYEDCDVTDFLFDLDIDYIKEKEKTQYLHSFCSESFQLKGNR